MPENKLGLSLSRKKGFFGPKIDQFSKKKGLFRPKNKLGLSLRRKKKNFLDPKLGKNFRIMSRN